jgi:hypothetical protein
MPDRRIFMNTAACQAPLRILRAEGSLIATIGRNKPSRLAQHSLLRDSPRTCMAKYNAQKRCTAFIML